MADDGVVRNELRDESVAVDSAGITADNLEAALTELDSGKADKAGTTYTQTYSTADRTVAAPTAVTTSLAAVATTGATNSSPYGFTTAAQADAIRTQVNLLVTAVLALIDDDLDNRQTLSAIIDDLQAAGIVS